MTTIDIIILAILVLGACYGAWKGFVHQIGTLAALLFAVLACRCFGADLVRWWVDASSANAQIYTALVYLLLFLAVFLCIQAVAALCTKVLSKLHVRGVDRLAGAVFSAAAVTLFLSIAFNLYIIVAPAQKAKFDNPNKPWRTAVVAFAPKLMGYITH